MTRYPRVAATKSFYIIVAAAVLWSTLSPGATQAAPDGQETEATPTPLSTPPADPTETPTVAATAVPGATATPSPDPTDTPSVSGRALKQPHVPDELVIRFTAGVSAPALDGTLRGLGAEVRREIRALGIRVLRVPEDRLEHVLTALSHNPNIAFVEPNYLASTMDEIPSDPRFAEQWGLAAIGAPAAWSITTGSADVTIAIVDTGVDLTHPDLDGKIVPGWDFVNNDADPQDDNGHGTHVAGIAAAESNNGIGIAGVSWGARIMPIKVLNSSGSGSYADVAAGIVYAVDNGAEVINLSLGGSAPSEALRAAIEYAYNANVVVVAAAGNTGAEGLMYPAAYPQVIAVGAVDRSLARVPSSSYGPELDLVAPGVDILSTCMGGTYCAMSGSSMAVPHVAGALAILAGSRKGLTAPEYMSTLTSSVIDIGSAGRDIYSGAGMIDLGHFQWEDLPVSSPTPTPLPESTPAPTSRPVALVPGTTSVGAEVEAALLRALQDAGVSVRLADYYAVTDVWTQGDWLVVSLAGINADQWRTDWNIIEDASWLGVILVHKTSAGAYRGALEGSTAFSDLLAEVPPEIISPEAKAGLDTRTPVSQAVTAIRFPWQAGTKMVYVQGVHPNGFSGVVPGWKAVDFWSDGNVGVGHAPNQLLAATDGTISYRCVDAYSVAVRVGEFFYTHLLDNAGLSVGRWVGVGNELGQMKTGSFSSTCGFANQTSGTFHVHWGFPDSGGVQVGQWSLDLGTSTWKRGAETRNPGDEMLAEVAQPTVCPGPSLSSPSDNYTSPSRTITFSWSPPSGCSFSGYTFRVKDTPDMNSGGTPLFDEGQGATSVTKSFGAEWDNRDLYWGVRTANPPSPNWSVFRFRIQPGVPATTAFTLYSLGDLNGDRYEGTSTISNLTTVGWNDRAQSIKIEAGFEVIVCVHDNFHGECGRATGYREARDIRELHSALRDSNDQGLASSVRVCSGSCPPGATAPILDSPSSGLTIPSTSDVVLSWHGGGSEYRVEVWGGNGYTNSFGWTNATSWNLGILSQSANAYYWRVQASNGYGSSGWVESTFYVGAPTVEVIAVSTTDTADQAKTDFNAGDPIRLRIHVNNSTGATATAYLQWSVRDPFGRDVPYLEWTGNLDTASGTVIWSLTPTLRATPTTGTYEFTGSVTYGGQTTSRTGSFNVLGPQMVEVVGAFTADMSGLSAATEAVPLAGEAGTKAASTEFSAGDSILLIMRVYNTTPGDATAYFTWNVTDPLGRRVDALSWEGDLVTGTGVWDWYITRTIPSGSVTGDYTFNPSIIYSGNLTALATAFHVTGPPAPANDARGSATAIGALPYTTPQSTVGATLESDEPAYNCGFNNAASVWFRFSPSQAGFYTIDTLGSDYDTVLHVFEDQGGGGLSPLVCNDDADGLQSRVILSMAGSTSYLISVAHYGNGTGGSLTLNLNELACPSTGLCVLARTGTGAPAQYPMVTVLDAAGNWVAEGTGGTDGYVVIDPIPAGTYRIITSAWGMFVVDDAVAAPGAITVSAEGLPGVEFVARDSVGAAIEAEVVLAESPSGFGVVGSTSAATPLVVNMTSGTYDVTMIGYADRYVLASENLAISSPGQSVVLDGSVLPTDTVTMDWDGFSRGYLHSYAPFTNSYWYWIDVADGQSVTLSSPGTDYPLWTEVSMAGTGDTWVYRFYDCCYTTGSGGASTTLTVGGAFAVTASSLQANYLPGQTGTLWANVTDAHANEMVALWHWDADATATAVQPGVLREQALGRQGLETSEGGGKQGILVPGTGGVPRSVGTAGQAQSPHATKDSIAGTAEEVTAQGTWLLVAPSYHVTDALGLAVGGSVVGGGLFADYEFPIPIPANEGIWGGEATVDFGPYQAAGSGTTTFNVLTVAISNDDIDNATLIADTPFATSQEMWAASVAPDDPTYPCTGRQHYRSVWYRYVAPTDGTLAVNTTGSDYDTVLAVWTGARGSLSNVACNDDTNGTVQSGLSAQVLGGTTYFVEIAGYSSFSSGSLNLSALFTDAVGTVWHLLLPLILR